MDVNKSHDDNNGVGHREKVKRVWQVSSWHCICHPQLWVENRDTCSRRKVMNCSVAKISVKRVCYSLKSHGKTLLEVSGGGENEEEKSVRKVEKGVREQSGNSREIVKRKGVDVFLERSSGKISLACGNLWC